MIRELPSGLLVVETPGPVPEPPPGKESYPCEPTICQICGRAEYRVPEVALGTFDTPEGRWQRHWWTCKHIITWECPKCSAVPWAEKTVFPKCPICGNEGEYT